MQLRNSVAYFVWITQDADRLEQSGVNVINDKSKFYYSFYCGFEPIVLYAL